MYLIKDTHFEAVERILTRLANAHFVSMHSRDIGELQNDATLALQMLKEARGGYGHGKPSAAVQITEAAPRGSGR